MRGKTREIGILEEMNSFENRIEIDEYLLQELRLVLSLKRRGSNHKNDSDEIWLTKETAKKLQEILNRWLKGII